MEAQAGASKRPRRLGVGAIRTNSPDLTVQPRTASEAFYLFSLACRQSLQPLRRTAAKHLSPITQSPSCPLSLPSPVRVTRPGGTGSSPVPVVDALLGRSLVPVPVQVPPSLPLLLRQPVPVLVAPPPLLLRQRAPVVVTVTVPPASPRPAPPISTPPPSVSVRARDPPKLRI
jgi:hypothetical protein